MLNIQLFLEGEEIELNEGISFPITKTFSHISNPTDILVEYSKTINIPATNKNNIIMAHAYRLDRQFVKLTRGNNIGIMLDPLKRIPMKLVYNGEVILDGYAKYTSATVNSKQTYYTFNLYGALGDVFQKLLDCVVDESMLNEDQLAEEDGGLKYVIPTIWEERVIDRKFIKDSWDHKDVEFDAFTNPHNCIGFAPAYRGLYDNFESTSMLGLDWDSSYLPPIGLPTENNIPTEAEDVETKLKNLWVKNIMNSSDTIFSGITEEQARERVDAIDYSSIIPNGLNEHQLRQFRSYEQKPYIYLPALMYLFELKCRELTDYNLVLDETWFNANNPYYSNLCYMLDYLSVGGNREQFNNQLFTSFSRNTLTKDSYNLTNNTVLMSSQIKYRLTDTAILNSGNITLNPITFGIENRRILSKGQDPNKCEIVADKRTMVKLEITAYVGKKSYTYYYWGSLGRLGVDISIPESINPIITPKYTVDNFVQMAEDTKYDAESNTIIGTGYLTIPRIVIPHINGDSVSIQYKATLECPANSSQMPVYGEFLYNGVKYVDLMVFEDNTNCTFVFPNTEYVVDWRDTTTCSLKNIYKKEEPLFNIILQYSKMMGLIWSIDYNKKTLTLQTRRSYFNNYEIKDWTNKVDKSKGMTIEPVSFNSKYIVFNYDDVEGDHYTGYRDKYGVNYGEKKIRTRYNFDIKETDLFKDKIHPSIISTKSNYSLDDLINWDTITKIPSSISEINFMDCENVDRSKSISLNNWYFRLNNFTTSNSYGICDLSPLEIRSGQYYWVSSPVLEYYNIITYTNTLPQFSPVYKSNVDGNVYGCLFNCPMEDYTRNGSLSNALGHYIYDICWSDFINERYNANNKKLTCYVKITPEEFNRFNANTFVLIDNQLFVVNKIADFDVNNNATKVELIQVTDINGYTNVSFAFPEVMISTNKVYLDTSGTDSAFIEINARSYPPVTDSDISIKPINVGSNRSTLYVTSLLNIGSTSLIRLNYASDGAYNERWDLQINKFNKRYTIPIYINNDLAIS